MCFSSTASFAAAGALGVAGFFTMKLVTNKRQMLLAVIPFLFALQQLAEGAIWIAHDNPGTLESVVYLSKYVFMFIAIFTWPVWIPLALWAVEGEADRRKWLAGLVAIGILYDALILFELIKASAGATVQVIGHSIQYQLPVEHGMVYATLYCLATVLPPFVSSLRYMWVLGIFNVIGLAVANYLYTQTFISVWCFFAAIVSIILYLIFRANYYKRQ